LFRWLRGLFRGGREDAALEARAEVGSLRLELEEKERALERLGQELERRRREEGQRVARELEDRWQALLSDLSSPLSLLLTQAQLLERGIQVPPQEVARMVGFLGRVLSDHGLEVEGRVGERVSFDPSRHDPGSSSSPAPGEEVVVRTVGLCFRGRVLKKAGVERE
jgi:molecular chaperone GrpE (heat shock protein)